jgi:hypothetical protein
MITGAGVGLGLIAAVFAFGELSHLRSSWRRLGSRGVGGSSDSATGGSGLAGGGAVRGAGGGSDLAGGGTVRGAAGGGHAVRGRTAGSGSDQIILVLGFRNRGTKANGLNRFRVRAGLRSIDPAAGSPVVIFCGGSVVGAVPEARLLDDYARDELGFAGRSLLETESVSTWENIAKATALIDEVLLPEATICIVSNSHHAEKAREHLWQMRPDLGARLVRGADYRFGELPLVKPIAAARGLLALREMDRALAADASR